MLAPFYFLSAVTLLFLVSGAAGLVHEIVWIKYLTLHVGASAAAQAVVVASFMAGLGLGGWVGGRVAPRLSRPARAYGLIEAAAALLSLALLPVLRSDALWSGWGEMKMLRLALAGALLVLPTTLMGASLPVLVEAAGRRLDIGRAIGWLYGINTVGAALGVLAATFWLFPAAGLWNTGLAAVACGLGVAVVAFFLKDGAARPAPKAAHHKASHAPSDPWGWVVFVTGFVSIFWEIGWGRLLAPVLGSSIYAFSIILFTYLVGIGLGGLITAWSPGLALVRRVRAEGCLFIAAVTAVVALALANHLPDLILKAAAFSEGRVAVFYLLQFLLCFVLMIGPATSLGLVLPFAMMRRHEARGEGAAAVGTLYASNTAGSILGSLAAGFVALPLVGVRTSVLAGAVVLGASTAFLAAFDRPPRRLFAGTLAAVTALLVALAPGLDQRRLHKGYFRSALAGPNAGGPISDLLFLREGLSCTVTVYRDPSSTYLKVNGKTDASTNRDMSTQYLLGHLPLFLAERRDRVCVIGLGSGATVRAAQAHRPVVVDVVELEPAVAETLPYFRLVNNDVMSDPSVRLHIDDGRSFLQDAREPYDIIISEPSNPWIAGVSALFTTEFYATVRSRLSPGGVFCQWIQGYELSQESLNAMLSTLGSSFRTVHVFFRDSDLVCVAGDGDIAGDPSRWADRFKEGDVAATLAKIGVRTPSDLFSGYLYSFPKDLDLFPSNVRNTDDNLWLEYRAPREMYLGLRPRFPLVAASERVSRLSKFFFPGLPMAEIASGWAASLADLSPLDVPRIGEIASLPGLESRAPALRRLQVAAAERWDLFNNKYELLRAAEQALFERDVVGARLHAEKALKGDPEDPTVRRVLARAMSAAGDAKGALGQFAEAVRLYPEDYVSLTELGLAALAVGRRDEGVRALRDAMGMNIFYTRPRAALMVALAGLGREGEAEALFEEAKAALPRPVVANLAAEVDALSRRMVEGLKR